MLPVKEGRPGRTCSLQRLASTGWAGRPRPLSALGNPALPPPPQPTLCIPPPNRYRPFRSLALVVPNEIGGTGIVKAVFWQPELEYGASTALKYVTIFSLLGLALSACTSSTVFNGEWIRGDWDTKSAMSDCQEVAQSQSYKAKCSAGGWSAKTNYGEVWLIKTDSKRAKSGEEITKIWVLKRP